MSDHRIAVAKPDLGEPEWQAVREVIESGWITQGPKVAAFEEALAGYCGAAHGVAMSSCTTALHLALVAAGVQPGQEVIVPSMSFIATANSVVHAGAHPVFAEVDPETYNLDLADTERRIGPNTAAILLVHQLGLPADIDVFAALAESRGLALVEDAAPAIGSRYKGRPIGSHSDLVCLSFHPRKVLTTGEGGMVLTSSAEYAERLRRLRHHGMSVSDLERHEAKGVLHETYTEVGYNYRMSDIHAAIGLEQLKRLPGMLARRRELASRYDDSFRDDARIATPVVPDYAEWNVQTYTVRLAGFDATRRDRVMACMLDAGIATRAGVMTAHREPAYASWWTEPLPISEAASDGSLVLPLHGDLTEDDQARVTNALVAALDEVT